MADIDPNQPIIRKPTEFEGLQMWWQNLVNPQWAQKTVQGDSASRGSATAPSYPSGVSTPTSLVTQKPAPQADSYLGMFGKLAPQSEWQRALSTQDDFLKPYDSVFGPVSSTVIGVGGAQNAAQSGKADMIDLSKAYKSVTDSQTNAAKLGFGSFNKEGQYVPNEGGAQSLSQAGFKRETGRGYSTELDAAGNVIAMHALSTPAEMLGRGGGLG
jgi:hypothetical protein